MYSKITVIIFLGFLLTGCSTINKALSCPEGQHSEFVYYMTIVHSNPDGSVWVQEMPIYECRSN